MKNISIKICSVVLGIWFFISCFPIYVGAKDGPFMGPGPKGDMFEKNEKQHNKILKELNLSPEQESKIREHRKQNLEIMKNLRQEIREKHRVLNEELDKPQSDKTLIDTTIKEINDLSAKMLNIHVENIMTMKNILTPEQFQKLKEIRERNKEKIQNKMKKSKEERRRSNMKECPVEKSKNK